MDQLAGAVEGVVKVGDASDFAPLFHFPQSIQGEDHVDILLKSRAVVINRGLGHDQIIQFHIAGDQPITKIAKVEILVISAMQTGGGHDGNPALLQGRARDSGLAFKGRAVLVQQMLSGGRMNICQTDHCYSL